MISLRAAFVFAIISFTGNFSLAGEARVMINSRCPVDGGDIQIKESSPLVVGLVAKVAGALAGEAIDKIAESLSTEKHVSYASGDRMSNWYDAQAGGSKVQINSKLVCLIFVVGNGFGIKNSSVEIEPILQRWDEVAAQRNLGDVPEYILLRSAAPELAKIGVTALPDFYLEAKFVVLDGGGAVFSIDPRFVYYPKFLGDGVLFGSNTRDVLVKIEFLEPGAASAFADTTFSFIGLQEGALNRQRIAGIRMPWSKQPPTGAGTTIDGRLVPFNIKALFTETAKPGVLGKVLAKVATEQKASIVTAVETEAKLALSQSERQRARGDAADAANTALTNYVAAYDAHEKSVKEVTSALSQGSAAEIIKAKNAEALARIRLANSEALARSAFDLADIPFSPMLASIK